jgi:PGF-pre-PGF domain-containing protein
MRRLSLLIIAILVLPSLAAALQDPYIVYGYVRYPDGSPAAQLPVDVHTPSQIKNTLSDSDGRYSVVFDNYNYSDPITVIVSGVEAYDSIDSSRPSSVISITVPSTSKETQPSGSGSGGGGRGGIDTGEEYENIELKEVATVYVSSGSNVSYQFENPEDPIIYVNYTALSSAGSITTTIEILKNTSALAAYAPPGAVYKNVNIWVGTYGYATEKNIKYPVIGFKVNRTWLHENQVLTSTIRLNRYTSGVWNPLPTVKTHEDTGYVYFESQTPGFSLFAITGQSFSTMNISKPGTYLVEVDGRSDTSKVIGSQISSTFIVVLAILAILSTTAVVYSFAQGTLSFDIIIGKAQAFERSLRRLIEK